MMAATKQCARCVHFRWAVVKKSLRSADCRLFDIGKCYDTILILECRVRCDN
jgi:hypothetical protein